MLALLKKDFFVLRKTCLIYVAMLLFYILLGSVNGDFSMFQALFVVVGMMLPITSMSYDERSKWDKYGMSLPLSRRTVVVSKYLFTGIAIAAGTACSILVVVLYTVLNREAMTAALFAQPVLFNCVGLALADLVLPLMYQFGTEKGRYAMLAVIWGIALIPVALVKLLDINIYAFLEDALAVMSNGGILASAITATILLTVVSVWVSAAIYERKELG